MDILRKRTFLEETASANVEANSGDIAMPDVADMMERTDPPPIISQLKLGCNSDEHASLRSLPGLQGTPVYPLLSMRLNLLE